MRSRLVMPVLALGLLAAPAWAEETPTAPADGMRPMAGAMMMRADANKDGVITKDEFMKQAMERAEARFKMMDKNGDGKLTADEMPRRPEAGSRRRGEPGMPPPAAGAPMAPPPAAGAPPPSAPASPDEE